MLIHTTAARSRAAALTVLTAALTLALLALTVLRAPTAGATPTTDRATAIAVIKAGHDATRRTSGLQPLVESSALDSVAQAWAQVMANRSTMVHSDHDANYSYATHDPAGYSRAAENIGYISSDDPAVLYQAWLDSPEHSATIHTAVYNTVGYGVAYSADGSMYSAVEFGAYATVPSPVTSSPGPSSTSSPTTSPSTSSPSPSWPSATPSATPSVTPTSSPSLHTPTAPVRPSVRPPFVGSPSTTTGRAPTASPTSSSTMSPTPSPTGSPTGSPRVSPSVSPTVSPTSTGSTLVVVGRHPAPGDLATALGIAQSEHGKVVVIRAGFGARVASYLRRHPQVDQAVVVGSHRSVPGWVVHLLRDLGLTVTRVPSQVY